MKVLFIGGTGVISTEVSKLAIKKKIDLWIFNRGKNNTKLPKKAYAIRADINNIDEMKRKLEGTMFDVVVQWISYTVDDVKRDYELFKGHTKQYIFISSASAYIKPIPDLPITEDMPLGNDYWEYSKNKQLCEEYLNTVNSEDFNVTIIRPSHTYDDSKLVFQLKSRKHPYTIVDRILNNEKIIMPDKGMSLWTLTYSGDFAQAFVDLFGNEATYGETYHLTSDKVYTWERIYEIICEKLDRKPNALYIPTDFLLNYFPSYKGELLGDKNHSLFFDNSKIKAVAPNYRSKTDYGDIVKKAIERLLTDNELQTIDNDFLNKYNQCIKDYEALPEEEKLK
ncbi:NAD dependent epimerase/dehydratase family protein [Candidatus Izimaplasma bacterium HR1]|jgi:nucleoside-diphosphate-sugar epimerase|uniref:NAD-dependent epimerase/dehydratase family protein n=1 Tax=Candidatus Izimoplasma sp. HR1 TaxID=1541959 RepID=UPI0004F8CC7F|nr:NAD dependent epimerase/dehydratase family protein [Candidatus Izimaplasma bacterium HR1]